MDDHDDATRYKAERDEAWNAIRWIWDNTHHLGHHATTAPTEVCKTIFSVAGKPSGGKSMAALDHARKIAAGSDDGPDAA